MIEPDLEDAKRRLRSLLAKVTNGPDTAEVPDASTMQAMANSSSSMSREELDARLELVEAKADARLSRFEERIDQAIGEMRKDRAEIKTEITEFRKDLSSAKLQMFLALLASVIAIYFGVTSANQSLLQGMLASFDSGRSQASEMGKVSEQLKAVSDRLDQAQKAAAASPPAPAASAAK